MKLRLALCAVCMLAVGVGLTTGRLLDRAKAQSFGTTSRVSVTSGGNQANDASMSAAISANGHFVAFKSWATNLVTGDIGAKDDIFVHDQLMAETTRASLTYLGGEANDHSNSPVISADGRYVAFHSAATNLVPGDGNGTTDVFVRDRHTGDIVCVSVDSAGNEGNGWSGYPSISADGRYVAFESSATDLVGGDTNGYRDIFVHDRDADGDCTFDEPGQINTVRVSVTSGGAQAANGNSEYAAISADGRHVAFYSAATDLVTGDANGYTDIFVHDRDTDRDGIFDEAGQVSTVRVSVSSGGAEAGAGSSAPAISGDGRYVAFESSATNLVGGDTNGYQDVFIHDRDTDGDFIFDEQWAAVSTTRVSVSSSNTEGDGHSEAPSVSFNGRYVAFVSWAYDLDSVCNYASRHVFVRDRMTGQTTCVSLASDGTQAYGDCWNPSISADGRYVAFGSDAENLVSGDNNTVRDVFIRDRGSGGSVAVAIPASGGLLAASGIVLDFPSGTFASTAVVTHTEVAGTVHLPPAGFISVGHSFELAATCVGTGQPVPSPLGGTYTVTISYSDEEKGPAIESTLALYYWDGSQWVEETSSEVGTGNNTVTAAPNHLSLWTVLGETRRVFLPLVLRNY